VDLEKKCKLKKSDRRRSTKTRWSFTFGPRTTRKKNRVA